MKYFKKSQSENQQYGLLCKTDTLIHFHNCCNWWSMLVLTWLLHYYFSLPPPPMSVALQQLKLTIKKSTTLRLENEKSHATSLSLSHQCILHILLCTQLCGRPKKENRVLFTGSANISSLRQTSNHYIITTKQSCK